MQSLSYVGSEYIIALLNHLFLYYYVVSKIHEYRKVASNIPVYYSIFDYFWGATNWNVLLTETCYYYHVQQSIKRWVKKRWHEFISIFYNYLLFLPKCRILKNSNQIFLNLYLWKCICKKIWILYQRILLFCEMEST